MKLKKKHFKRLKGIAEKLNHELNYSGLSLSDLIADIESVQKVKTIQEKPLNKTAAFLEVCAKHQEDFLDDSLSLSNKEPKIGDVGYFWITDTSFVSYGKVSEIIPTGFRISNGTLFRNFSKTPPELR